MGQLLQCSPGDRSKLHLQQASQAPTDCIEGEKIMGGVQRYMELIDARGWADVGKLVCSQCLTDSALSNAVRAAGNTSVCDYCGTKPVAPEATAAVEIVLDLIVDGFRYEYEDPVEQVLYSSADGGYQMAVYDAWDLLGNHEVTEDGALIDDLGRAIQQDGWVQRDPYAASPANALRWGWAGFRQFVKHQRRYTFLVQDDTTASGAGEIAMHGIPAAIADAVETAGQIRTLKAGTKWWRVRVHATGETHTSAAALGSPPSEWARDNRMTAKGIGAFYGASTLIGARAEVSGYADPKDEGTVGEFELLRDISVVDLTDADDIPSLFDVDERHKRAPIMFMRDFVDDVARIADPSDRQNLDYVPTQVVSEFFRYGLEGNAGPVGGVLWRSSKNPLVQNCVLFATNSQMAEPGGVSGDSWLLLDPSTVRTISGPL